jgi:hypothetical protein
MQAMAKTIKHFSIVTGITVLFLMIFNNIAFAQGLDPMENCPAFLATLNGCQGGLRGIVLAIVNFFLGFLGLLTVIMVIYGGFLYVSSAGNEESTGKAKKILLYSAMGILIIIVSFALVNTILGAASGQ